MPQQHGPNYVSSFDRRQFLMVSTLAAAGCNTVATRAQSPDRKSPVDLENSNGDIYIGDISSVWGLNDYKIEGIGLVTQLDGTGSDPAASSQRTMLLNEMQTHRVPKPKEFLSDMSTSMVLIRGYLPPAVQKGGRFDLEIRTLPRSETTSLKGGYLLQARLRKMEVMGGRVQMGNVNGLAEGRVMVDSIFESGDDVLDRRGRIYGGGVATTSRPVGLVIRADSHSVRTTTTVAKRINQRFHTISNGGKTGVATPKNDKVVELLIPATYKNNIGRFMGVASHLIYRDSSNVVTRIDRLEKELKEPALAARAAMRLEAIGREGIAGALNRGLRTDDLEVQFYAAEALAYLGEKPAAKVLGRIAQAEPAFRWRAMTALSTMDELEAGIALSELLHVQSAETRYGAFRALHARSAFDPAIHHERLPGNEFAYHVIPTHQQPMIHFSKSRRAELLLFGDEQRVSDSFLYVDKGLTIKVSDGRIRMTRFKKSGGDERKECSTLVDDLIRNMVAMEMGYGEVLEVLRQAKDAQMLDSRLVIDATQKSMREYQREEAEGPVRMVSGPVPDLYRESGEHERPVRPASYEAEIEPETENSSDTRRGLFGKMKQAFGR